MMEVVFSHLMTNIGDVEPSILVMDKYSDGRHHELAKVIEVGERAYYYQESFAYPFAIGATFVDFNLGYVVEVVDVDRHWLYLKVGNQTNIAPVEMFTRAIHDGRIVEL